MTKPFHNKATKYRFKEKFDYPLDKELIKIIEQEYRDESIDKGNSWRAECSLDYLLNKLDEEYQEVQLAFSRKFPPGYIQSELVDLILVAAMLHRRLEEEETRRK